MNARNFLRLGLVAVLLAFLVPVLGLSHELAAKDRLDTWAGWLLNGAGLSLAVALILYVLEKIGLRVSGSRCRDCHRSVPYGHAYCLDHLRVRTDAARDRHHGKPGMGV